MQNTNLQAITTIQYLEKVLASEELRYEIVEQELLEIGNNVSTVIDGAIVVGEVLA